MNLRRQLLLVSLLTLILPWAGCQFIRETESALREGQQQMLGGTAQAIADSLSQFSGELLPGANAGGRLYAHPLSGAPLIDGYVDDWALPEGALQTLRSVDGPLRYAFAEFRQHWYLYVDVADANVVFTEPGAADGGSRHADHILLVSIGDNGEAVSFDFAAEAPGDIVPRRQTADQEVDEPRIDAKWQDTATGYRLEARIPRSLVGPRIGVVVENAPHQDVPGVTSSTFEGPRPGVVAALSPVLQSVAASHVQPGLRLIITDRDGWRLAEAGSLSWPGPGGRRAQAPSGWLRLIYNLLLEPGAEAALAEPAPGGRESQAYVEEALNGEAALRWFRSTDTGRAVVSVAQPIWSGTVQTGVVILQQGTDAILSLTNRALTRLIILTLIVTLVVAAVLLGYASWLSQRIRRLSEAAERALDEKRLLIALPSALAADEVGDLSRSFSSVLRQLGVYNEYLRTLAGKLSHELRTPLTIVRSSLENLEHEVLADDARAYTLRAREGTDRLQKILNAMSEANRTEELMANAEPENFRPSAVLTSTVRAYADAWPDHDFVFEDSAGNAVVHGSPELVIQMLDKLVDNAVGFTEPGGTIRIRLSVVSGQAVISVRNPGPPLPERMREELFHSMVSVRASNDEHLGVGLYVARLIAEGHNGFITADNTKDGVEFAVHLPLAGASPGPTPSGHGRKA